MSISLSEDSGRLILIPTTLGKTPENNTIPEYVLREIRSLDILIVENIQTALRYIQWVGDTVPEYKIRFFELNRHTRDQDIQDYIKPALEGKNIGLLSESGCPAVADPGSAIVQLAHQYGIKVVPLVGPNSMLLALMASGFNGQRFAFHGYLPAKNKEQIRELKKLEQESRNRQMTQLFMEAPHRNMVLLENAIQVLDQETWLCSATDLTLPSEEIHSQQIWQWQVHQLPDLNKRPTIFVLFSGQDVRQRKKKKPSTTSRWK